RAVPRGPGRGGAARGGADDPPHVPGRIGALRGGILLGGGEVLRSGAARGRRASTDGGASSQRGGGGNGAGLSAPRPPDPPGHGLRRGAAHGRGGGIGTAR